MSLNDAPLRHAIRFVVIANFAYFFVEFAVALHIGSVALFADSIDFLEDASVNFLILLALTWPVQKRAKLGMVLAGLLLMPSLVTLWAAWQKFQHFAPPDGALLSITGVGALLINIVCAAKLVKFRHDKGSLTKAAFFSARNDAIANIAIILAGIVTLYTLSAWPDLIVGLIIAVINARAAKEVWETSRQERLEAAPHNCNK